jgi:pilus assembly protein CpaF
MSLVMAELLTLCVRLRLNILVSGGTGSGKTTLLNILGECIPAGQRLVTIEDSAELQIHHPHVISLESRPENSEGHGQVSIRQLVRNAMRMRPDRIVVGEVRGVEAFDMLVAMNTGHEGSLTTLHANSTRDALARLETMVLTASVGLPLQAIREQISSAIQIIIQQSRLPCGRRLITRIAEISGIESGTIQMQTLVHFDPMSQQFIQSALPPAFFESHACHGEPFVQSWFARV